ncbi:glycoside hydrolase family 2 protein [Cucurbitaria berberidis CBS 394.84]|uniref:Beta-mannosidase n=1 Tax=Cucurbitaria berberidis CBS 394.84 TaxID=1168544 RepID=A0A9P4GRX1_9PLEO|nr:glycoside hydrolase family 2 protein [Cucurbitaria berberidis CBS 394.84]KAF1850409.1 glycoside hydrolase family 2 protein [Cucurbitaria berberidis CBS 394.84]
MEAISDVIPFSSTPLTTGWTFKQGDRSSGSENLAANDLPTEIYRDLLLHGKIADPFQDVNELSVRWVADETWTYCTTFNAPRDYGHAGVSTILKFEGLDTFASVFMNGQLILASENMFLESRVDVTGKLKRDGNTLEIVFESARKKGLELVEQHKEHRFIVHQTEISRGPVRKAQYHWGWDWGPILLTCGPWKPIVLETYKCRIFDLWASYELAADLKSAEVRVQAKFEGLLAGVSFAIINQITSETVARTTVPISARDEPAIVEVSFRLDDIDLWWPRGYGTQALYTVRADAHTKVSPLLSAPIHSISQTFGFRKTELIQEPDTHGTSFYFRINNVDIFCGGSCWIPADSLLTRLTPEEYRSWVLLAAEGNQTMLRVWGGGIYESDAFYDAADELGILVWQDFAFACANYPAHAEYLKSVEEEARQNVRRLRNHPSLVIWAGNNEDYQIVERYGLEYNLDDKEPRSWLKTNFPARYIYEYLLPTVMIEEFPGVPYHPSSPFGNGKSTVLKVDPTIGDVHQWNVWHGTMEPYQKLPDMGGRFVSEFGMEAYPHVSTLEKCITRDEDRYPGSMAMDFRNKAIGHERRLVSYVAENFRIRYDVEGFAHLTQVMQADAMSWAYKGWRRQWGASKARKCGGVLVWQLNDCWPTMSWSVVDYHLVPKPSYYAIKRAMEPVVIGVQRKFNSWTTRPADELWQRETGHIDMRRIWQHAEFDVWVANSKCEEIEGKVVVKYFSIKTGEELGSGIRRDITITPNGTTEVIQGHTFDLPGAQNPDEPFNLSEADPFVIHASLTIDRRCVATDISWPDPIKYLSFSDRDIEVCLYDDGTKVVVSATKPVKGFVFVERPGTKFSDNGFDLVPGEPKEVRVTGCSVDDLKWRYIEM